MRQSFYDTKFIHNKSHLCGINLGYDHCAEHEWGIDILNCKFKVNTSDGVFGIDKRKITTLPDNLFFEEKGNKKIIACSSSHYIPDYMLKDEKLTTAWSERDFCIASTSHDMNELWEAFQNLDIAIGLGGKSNPFAGSGLIFMIVSNLPNATKQSMYNADKEYYDLQKDAHATGIYELLKEHGKKFFALSPARDDDGSIRFWLNPYEQDKYNFGWYTLKDLQDWANDKGVIVRHA